MAGQVPVYEFNVSVENEKNSFYEALQFIQLRLDGYVTSMEKSQIHTTYRQN